MCSFITVFSFVQRVRNAELIVLDLYKNNFEEYLVVNNNFEIEYDLESLRILFEEKGYIFKPCEGDLCFVLSFKSVCKWENKYKFYLEKNYDFK